jgi:hypothetical protein
MLQRKLGQMSTDLVAFAMQGDSGKGRGAKSLQWRNKDVSAYKQGQSAAGSYKARGDSASSSGLRCELCHMRNHTRDNCFYEHPEKAPAGWKPRMR